MKNIRQPAARDQRRCCLAGKSWRRHAPGTLNLADAVARLPAINFEAPSFARYSRREQ
jgi:hypothetical protein